jgi:chromosome segregation ATPase
VHEIYPELVAFDEHGEIYSVNYMALVPLLIKQIQELEARNQNYEQDIAFLSNDSVLVNQKVNEQQQQIKELRTMINQLMALMVHSTGA